MAAAVFLATSSSKNFMASSADRGDAFRPASAISARVCPTTSTGAAAKAPIIPSITAAHRGKGRVRIATVFLRVLPGLPRLRPVQADRLIHHLFHERHTVELDQLGIRLDVLIEWETYLPRPTVDLRVFERGFVPNVVRADRRPALDDMQRVAVEIAG